MDIQALMDAIGAESARQRTAYHLTLGEMITELSKLPEDIPIRYDCTTASPTSPHSYRGYYSDLAFEQSDSVRTVGSVLLDCKQSLGKVFTGYKGGDYTMTEDTPLWAAEYSCCGKAMMGLSVGDTAVVILTKEID